MAEEERRGRSGGGLTMGKRKGWGKKIGREEKKKSWG